MKEINNIIEKNIKAIHLELNQWLCEELIIGLEKVGVTVEIQKFSPMEKEGNFKSILKIVNTDSGKIHMIGLNQKIKITIEK